MKHRRTATAVVTVTLTATLAACGGTSTPAAPSPEEALRTAVQGYDNAVLAGDVAGASGYLHADCRNDTDRGDMALAAATTARTAAGARMFVDSVTVAGDRGAIRTWHLSPGAPDALRRLIGSATDSAAMQWRLVAGEWYFRSTSCTGGATPS